MLGEISIGYDPVEDRLLLRFRSGAGDGELLHRLLLTRRLSLSLRVGLRDLVRRSAQVPQTLSEPTRRVLEAGHHQARLKQTTMHTEQRRQVPDGGIASRLVFKAVCGTRRRDSKAIVRFEFPIGEPLTIELSERTLHALAAGLDDRVRRAGWIAEADAPVIETSASPAPPLSTELH